MEGDWLDVALFPSFGRASWFFVPDFSSAHTPQSHTSAVATASR
jgi:hypothetical protein